MSLDLDDIVDQLNEVAGSAYCQGHPDAARIAYDAAAKIVELPGFKRKATY